MRPSPEPRVAVIGAGIVGASIAYHLARRGARVTLLEREAPAAGASGRSFGWINASFGHRPDYHRLRQRALLEYRRLERELPAIRVSWCGSLFWLPGAPGEAIERLVEVQQRRGYPVRVVDAAEFADLEPRVKPVPARAAFAEGEGAIDAARATRALLAAAERCGAQLECPCAALGLDLRGGRLRALRTSQGALAVDVAVLAAGVETPRLACEARIAVPLEDAPGLLVNARAAPPLTERVLLTPGPHVRGQPDGGVVAGLGFEREPAHEPTRERAEEILAACRSILPGLSSAELQSVRLGRRPMPVDELPIAGFAGSARELYVAVTHSGVTLAALIGRLAALEILEGVDAPELAPYRPARFR